MYTISLPSGTFRKNGVVFQQDDNDPVWQEYAMWLAAGNGPTQIDDQGQDARQRIAVTGFQLDQALIELGLDTQIENFVAQSGNKVLISGWRRVGKFESDHPLVMVVAQGIGKTEDEMYAVFELAETK